MFRGLSQLYKLVRDPWLHSPDGARSRRKLGALRDRHLGEDIAIIATGPSLLETDLVPFAHMPQIGLNRLYLAAEKLGVAPDYHIVANDLMAAQFAPDLQALGGTKFLPWTSRRHFTQADRSVFLNFADSIAFEPEQMLHRVPVGATVTFAAIHLAYWLGAQRVFLLGVDHHYEVQPHEKGLDPHAVSERRAPDTNHVHPDYFGRGTHWQMPDLETAERAYLNARNYFEAQGRKILNATPGSRLEVFERTG